MSAESCTKWGISVKSSLSKGGEQKNKIRQRGISWICLAMHLWFLWRRGENTFDILTCLSLPFQGHLLFCPFSLTYDDLLQSSENRQKFHWFSISFMKSGLFPRHSDDAGQQGIVKSTLHQLPFLWNISFRPQGVLWVNIEKYVYTLRPPTL